MNSVVVPVRWMSRIKKRFTHPPYWQPRQNKVPEDENLTLENKQFLQDAVEEKYGTESADAMKSVRPGTVSPLREEPWPRGQWEEKSQRTGLIARKIGVYPMWKTNGTRILTTLLQVVDNHVIKYHPPDEYIRTERGQLRFRGKKKVLGCLVVGAESRDPQMFTREYCGLFTEAGVMPKLKLTRFYVTPNAALQPGTPLYATHFRPGDYVDLFGTTIDHGFQGVMKRWGFKGLPATHGVTKSHRSGGYIGSGSEKSRVWPGTKMPGHMGGNRVVHRGIKILRINTKYNVIYVQGPAVPGEINNFVYIMDSLLPRRVRKEVDGSFPFPTWYPEDVDEPLPEELYSDDLHVFSDPTITFTDKVS